MFLEHQIIILEWFLKDLKTGVMILKWSALITGINYTLLHSKKCWVVLIQFLGKIWTNSNFGLKMSFKMLTQLLGLSIFDPNLGW